MAVMTNVPHRSFERLGETFWTTNFRYLICSLNVIALLAANYNLKKLSQVVVHIHQSLVDFADLLIYSIIVFFC